MIPAKQAAIAAAYGSAWEKVKDWVDENGICNKQITHCSWEFPEKLGFKGEWEFCDDPNKWRPISLRNMETNNGWIRCEDRLPEGEGEVRYCMDGRPFSDAWPIEFFVRMFAANKAFTHWRPIENVQPPIY